MTAFRSTLCALLLAAAAASALPAALLSEDGVPQDSPNRAAINVAMFGGVGRRSEAPRARRQVDGSDLGEVFSAESSYNTEGAPGRARRSVVSPVLAIESPFAPTMDVEDARRMRRANQAAGEGSGGREGGVGDVDYDHFPSKRAVDDYSDETYDDHDGVFYDDPVSKLGVRDRRQSKVEDANHDDGDDEAEEHNDRDDVEDVDCDMNGKPLPTRAPEPDVNDSSQRALADDSDEAAAQAVTPTKPTTEVADDCTTVTSFSVSTTSSDADAEEAPRLIREAPSEALIIKTLLEAPIDETILGELPVRRARRQVNAPQATQVADGVPVNYIQPLSSGAALPAEPASEYSPGPGVLPTTGEKALQIYTVHRMASEPAAEPAIQPDSPAVADATSTSPLVIAAVPVLVPQTALGQGVLTPGFESRVEIVTPSPPTPSPASPATAMPVLASESAVDGVLPPGPTVHVNILPAPEATTHREPQAEVPQQPPVIADVVSLDNPAIMPSDAGQVPRPFRPSLPETVDSIVAMQGLTQDHQEDPGFLTFPPPRQQFQVGAPQYNGAKPAGFAPLVEKSIYVGPDGTYMYSYETADGVKVSETGALKEVPAQTEGTQAHTGTQAGTDPSSPSTRLANTVSGGYSYTAPDGTYFSLRYVADENGFRPVVGGGLGGLPSDRAAPFAGRGA